MNRRKFILYVTPSILTLAVRPLYAGRLYGAVQPLMRDAAAPDPKARKTTGGDPLIQRVVKAICGVGGKRP